MMNMTKYEKLKKLLDVTEEVLGPEITPEQQEMLNGFRERLEKLRKQEIATEKLCARLQEISDEITELSREIYE